MKLYFKEYGSAGEPLIILHGLLGSLDNWHSIAGELGAGFRVIAVDQRNHGHSPHSDEFSYDLMVADLLELIEDQKPGRINLLGHSMGAKTAMKFALQYPGKVSRLIIADMAPKAYPPGGHDDVFRALFAVNLSQIKSRKDGEEQISNHMDDFAVKQFLLKNLSRNPDGSYSWKMNLQGIYDNYANIIGPVVSDVQYTGPAMFIRGGRSGYVKDEDMEQIRELFPNSKLVTVEGAGHWLHAEAPAAFLKEVISFLNS
jgi:esterase